jgi:hypothetical protein
MTHHAIERIQGRLAQEGVRISENVIIGLCYECDTDTAVIIAKTEHKGDNTNSYYGRTDSNGDMVVLIIRHHEAITIMFRRSSQTNTPEQLRVNQIIDLTN